MRPLGHRGSPRRSFSCRIQIVLAVSASIVLAGAQEPPDKDPAQEQTQKNKGAPCLEPAPLTRWEDYEGPFKKLVGTIGRKLERKAAHAPRYKPGTVLCSLEVKDKFALFVQDTVEPLSLLAAGFNAGLDQASNRDPSFGRGGVGYAKRYSVNFASQTAWRFFTDFAYPTVFSEDPRYYRLGQGNAWRRLWHAARHSVIAHRDNGTHMFNYSEWVGTATAVALNNAYHPGTEHGFAPALRQVGFSVLEDVGYDVFREFWPEIARKLRIPFRGLQERRPPDGKQ